MALPYGGLLGNKFFWVYMAVVRLIFRPCVGNHPMGVRFVAGSHPSVTFGDSANSARPLCRFRDISPPRGESPPQGAPISRVQNLKINRARPANGPMAGIGPYKCFAMFAARSTTMIHDSLLFILSSASNSSLLIPDS